VNFITAHDGFTLADLVSYNRKHNLANGEDNRDGENHNNSWNHGIEGPSNNPLVQTLRRRQQRNLLSSLLLARGVPMLLMGDEVGRSQEATTTAGARTVHWAGWSGMKTTATWNSSCFCSGCCGCARPCRTCSIRWCRHGKATANQRHSHPNSGAISGGNGTA
jgi:pullulanase/glycogen debranching enzyme